MNMIFNQNQRKRQHKNRISEGLVGTRTWPPFLSACTSRENTLDVKRKALQLKLERAIVDNFPAGVRWIKLVMIFFLRTMSAKARGDTA